MDMNRMAGAYAGKLCSVVGVFNAVLPIHRTFYPYTADSPTPSPGFLFVKRGSGSFTFNDTEYRLSPGTVLHGGKGMSLVMSTQHDELEYILVRYVVEPVHTESDTYCSDTTNAHFLLNCGISPQLPELLEQLRESFFTPGHMALIRTQYLFSMLVYEVFVSCLNRQSGDNKDKIEQARMFIHNHYMDSLSLQQLAERQGMTSKSFSYFFKKHTGMFPIDYLIQHRMKRAQELLMMSECSIKQVAESVGYEDALYFSKVYKKHFGHTPSQTRM